jgi:hypothetical protein
MEPMSVYQSLAVKTLQALAMDLEPREENRLESWKLVLERQVTMMVLETRLAVLHLVMEILMALEMDCYALPGMEL